MKKALLMSALMLSVSVVSAQAPQSGGLVPLTGTVTFMTATGEEVGGVNSTGMVFMGSDVADVTTLRIVADDRQDGRATAYRLLTGQDGPAMEVFGPRGERMVMKLPQLHTMKWVALNGRESVMNLP